MDKDQVEGRIKAAAGKVQRQAGKLAGSKKQEFKGGVREQEGKVENTAGDLQEVHRESGTH